MKKSLLMHEKSEDYAYKEAMDSIKSGLKKSP